MANGPDYYMKLFTGDVALMLSVVRAENDALREKVAELEAQQAKPKASKEPKP